MSESESKARRGRPPVYGETGASSNVRTAEFRSKLSSEGLKRVETFIPEATYETIGQVAMSEGVSKSQAVAALVEYGLEKYREHTNSKIDFTANEPPVQVQSPTKLEKLSVDSLRSFSSSNAGMQSYGAIGSAAPNLASGFEINALDRSPIISREEIDPPLLSESKIDKESPIARFFRSRQKGD